MSSLTCHPTSAAASSMSRWLSKEKGTTFRLDSPQRPVLRDSRRRAISCEVEDAESSAAKTWLTCVKDFDISKARLIGFTHHACACGSFRKQDKILWTTPCVILHKAQEHRRIMVRAAAAIESPTFHRGPSIRSRWTMSIEGPCCAPIPALPVEVGES
jgi:hypothetical protein